MGSVWRRLGAEVTMLEALAVVPAASSTRAIAKEAQKLFTKQGLAIHTGVKITDVKVGKNDVTVAYNDARASRQPTIFDHLIVSIGRVPFTGGLDAEAVGLALDERGFVAVDDDCRTNLPNVWAIGDVVRGPDARAQGRGGGRRGRRAHRRPEAARRLQHRALGDLHVAGDRVGRARPSSS